MTAVSAVAGELGLPTLTHDTLIQKCLKAAARRRSSAEQQKLPVLKDLMEALLQSGDDKYASVRDNAFYLLAWLGMFRTSKLLALEWKDVQCEERGLVIVVRKSKTDQAGVGFCVFLGKVTLKRAWCPVAALYRLACHVPAGQPLTGFVFRRSHKNDLPLSSVTLGSRFKRRLRTLGVQHEFFALHSFRSGGATAASAAEMSRRVLKGHGKWRSGAVDIYTRDVEDELWDVTRLLTSPI